MALITYTNKDDTQPEGDPRKHFTDDDANEIKTVVNVNDVNTAGHIAQTNNPHSVTKTQVGLGNVDNTSDANKPVSTAQQTALDLKANLASPTFTGTPAGPTASPGTNTTQLATTAFVIAAAGASTVADGDKGDITVSSSGAVWNIDAGVVGGTEIASSVALAGNPTTTTQSAGTNNTRIATTAYADAKVADAINNGTTAIAPSQNAVFDALALKANSSDVPLTTTFVDDENVSGTKNDINVTFTLANTPISGTVKLYWNGMRMKVGVGFTISTATLTMTIAPSSGDTLVADYRK